jgi:hypothetical protein
MKGQQDMVITKAAPEIRYNLSEALATAALAEAKLGETKE